MGLMGKSWAYIGMMGKWSHDGKLLGNSGTITDLIFGCPIVSHGGILKSPGTFWG